MTSLTFWRLLHFTSHQHKIVTISRKSDGYIIIACCQGKGGMRKGDGFALVVCAYFSKKCELNLIRQIEAEVIEIH